MPNRDVVLSAPLRTAIGTFGGALKETTATELGATAVRAVLARSKLDHAKVQTVVMGNVVQAGNKMNPARQAAINGGAARRSPGDDGEPGLWLRRAGHRRRPRRRSCSATSIARLRAAWRTWTARRISWAVDAGAIASATLRFSTAC